MLFIRSDETSLNEALKDARIRLGNRIRGASQRNAYKRTYNSAIYLHILHELPLIDKVCCMSSANAQVGRIAKSGELTFGRDLINHRLELISSAFRYREHSLCPRFARLTHVLVTRYFSRSFELDASCRQDIRSPLISWIA